MTGRALFGLGLLLPLTGGGNVLLALEPEVAMMLFSLASVGLAGRLLAGEARVEDRRAPLGRITVASLLLVSATWIGALLLRPCGPRAALEAQGMLCAILLFVGFSRQPRDVDSIAALVHGLLCGALLTALYGQYQYWIAFPRTAPLLAAYGIPTVSFVNASFYNANCYAAFLSATILLAAGLVIVRRDLFATIAIVPLALTLLLSRSRSSMVLLVIALSTLWWTTALRDHWRRLSTTARFSILAAAGGLGSIGIAAMHLEKLWRVGLLGRVAIWQGSVAMIRDHWLWGVGLGRFWEHFPEYQVTDYYTRYPHSFLLEIFAELGIAGFLAIVLFLASAFARPLSALAASATGRDAIDPLRLAIALACSVLLVHGAVDIDWHAPANPILLLLLLGVAQQPAPTPAVARASGARG